MKTTTDQIAKLTGGRIARGGADDEFTNFASLDLAERNCVAFYGNPKYRDQLASTQAGLVLVPSEDVEAPPATALVVVDNPVLAFDAVVKAFGVAAIPFKPGIHEAAWVAATARADSETVSVGPNATVEAGASIGRGTRIASGAFVGQNAVIGEDCEIGPNAVIREGCLLGDRVVVHGGAIIGADGFGFEFVDGRHRKVEQLGIVRIGDDVEIGASTTIDRARFGETVIGEGTKIDNQVQIAHNVVVGKHCIIVAQVGISGSTRIGDYVTLAAQTGVAGHLRIADKVTCGGRSGVISSIEEEGGVYFGYPARPLKEDRREQMRIKQLGGLMKRVRELERKLGDGGVE